MECLETWTEKKHEGRDGHVITIVLMQITRTRPGEFLGLSPTTLMPRW
jgi:hypothetical protein